MSRFTYELENQTENLETYEWDNTWFEYANKDDINRVLYIGDSISCGTRGEATRMSEGRYFFDGLGTSKAIDNPYFTDAISLFAKQERSRKIVLFNNGLHGGHLGGKAYFEHYEKMVQFLIKEFPDTKIVLLLSTFINRPDEVENVVKVRNEKVLELAEKYNLPVIDLFKVAEENKDKLCGDGIHFEKEGYEKLAEEIIKRIDEILG